MAGRFIRETIQRKFELLGHAVECPITVYLVGGGAMVAHDMRESTQDLDLLVPTRKSFDEIDRAIRKTNYGRSIERKERDEVGSMRRYYSFNGHKIETFYRQIGQNLYLTDGMMERSTPFLSQNGLSVFVISAEDIYVGKLMSGRMKDVPDSTRLRRDELDFEIIDSELISQEKRLERNAPGTLLFNG